MCVWQYRVSSTIVHHFPAENPIHTIFIHFYCWYSHMLGPSVSMGCWFITPKKNYESMYPLFINNYCSEL